MHSSGLCPQIKMPVTCPALDLPAIQADPKFNRRGVGYLKIRKIIKKIYLDNIYEEPRVLISHSFTESAIF